MEKVKIADRLVGNGEPCFIIAEAGVNHNGNVKLAKKLIDAAKKSKADAVKFQTFRAEGVVSKYSKTSLHQKTIRKKESQQNILKKLELSYKYFVELKNYCDKKDIIFLSTPHSDDAIDFLNSLVPAYKIGSGDLTNIPFLQKIAKKNKPIILSTGMATMEEVKEALNTIYLQGDREVVVLHCTTSYPCSLNDVNLRAMKTIQKELNCLVGYSDHTLGISASIAAVVLGAAVIEKHFTLDKNLSGPDHKASLEPSELKKMIQEIRNVEDCLRNRHAEDILKSIKDVEKILGNPIKKPIKIEKKIKRFLRKSIVASLDIQKGSIIRKNMISIKRPGTGIPPKFFDKIIGKKTKQDIGEDELISFEQLT